MIKISERLAGYDGEPIRWYLSYGGVFVGDRQGYQSRAAAEAARAKLDQKGRL